jgi:hypothetical protein
MSCALRPSYVLWPADKQSTVESDILLTVYHYVSQQRNQPNTLRTGDANLRFLRFCITTVKDG